MEEEECVKPLYKIVTQMRNILNEVDIEEISWLNKIIFIHYSIKHKNSKIHSYNFNFNYFKNLFICISNFNTKRSEFKNL